MCVDLQYVWEVFSIRGHDVPLSANVLENGDGNERSCRFKLKMFDQLMAFLEGFQCQQFIIFIIKLVVLREMVSIMTNLMSLPAQTQQLLLGIIFMRFI